MSNIFLLNQCKIEKSPQTQILFISIEGKITFFLLDSQGNERDINEEKVLKKISRANL
jgi:hypothetical protein